MGRPRDVEVTRVPGRAVTLSKRQHLPYTIAWTCPGCAAGHTLNLSNDGDDRRYLSYPKLPGINEVTFYCHECGWEGSLEFYLTLSFYMAATNGE